MSSDPISFLGVSETVARVSVFLGAFMLFSILEALAPRRVRTMPRIARWWTNGAMLVLANLLVRALAFVFPLIAATAGAGLASSLGIGLFNWLDWPIWLEVILAMVILDMAIWAQHVISHKVPIFWRLHRVHHADRDFDASTALRFHPVEIALSALYKLVIILLLGPAIVAVILFEIVLNASAMFNHANLALPLWLDRWLRLILVTPDMHRVHHSVHVGELNTNYGFCLSIWDRLFRTYTAQPKDGHQGMRIGLTAYQTDEPKKLSWSLILPVK